MGRAECECITMGQYTACNAAACGTMTLHVSVQVNARQLHPPQLDYCTLAHDGSSHHVEVKPRDKTTNYPGSWNMNNLQFHKPAALYSFGIASFVDVHLAGRQLEVASSIMCTCVRIAAYRIWSLTLCKLMYIPGPSIAPAVPDLLHDQLHVQHYRIEYLSQSIRVSARLSLTICMDRSLLIACWTSCADWG